MNCNTYKTAFTCVFLLLVCEAAKRHRKGQTGSCLDAAKSSNGMNGLGGWKLVSPSSIDGWDGIPIFLYVLGLYFYIHIHLYIKNSLTFVIL